MPQNPCPAELPVTSHRYQWAAPGDVNAFFGLMLDNIAGLLLTVGLLQAVFEFPAVFALQHMVPGTAVGVLVGDLLFFWMAIRLARRTGRSTVTAMPLGLDTPSTFGMIFFVLGPAFLHAKFNLGLGENEAAVYTWHIGICAIVISGVFKLFCALGANWVRRVVPRAGLLGSLAAIALVLISFLPLMEILHYPVAGLAALAVILTTLVARIRMPGRIPGALGALLVGGIIYYVMLKTGTLGHAPQPPGFEPREALLPTGWFDVFRFGWIAAVGDSLTYLPLVIPFALATVIGGIDCTESAAAAGDEFNTNRVIGVEAVATLVAGLCGGVIQTTPYIGHPAYKAMGGRAAYTLATAVFVGGAGLIGYFGYLYLIIPKVAVFGILVFIGLEITAQSFQATVKRHYAAVALGCVPAMAALVMIYVGSLQGQYASKVGELNAAIARLKTHAEDLEQQDAREALDEVIAKGAVLRAIAGDPAAGLVDQPEGDVGKNLQTVRILASGFIVTSLLWASAMAAIIDRRFLVAAAFLGIAAVCSFFGIIHSPMPGSPLINPFSLPANLPHNAAGQTPLYLAAGYAMMALLMLGWAWWQRWSGDDASLPQESTSHE